MNEVGYQKPPEETQFKPGETGNPNGRPKGRKNLATVIRELEAEDYDWNQVPLKGAEAIEFAETKGTPWRAIVIVALQQALKGSIPAMEWLKRAGYGDKLDIESGGKPIQAPAIISFIQARNVGTQTETTDSN